MDREVVGAINAAAPHPTDPAILYVGAVNGGIWMTRNAQNTPPSWQSVTEDFPSLSIGDVSFDPTDPNLGTLVAGSGRFSSMRRAGGSLLGVLRTRDAGATWAAHDNGGVFRSLHIRSVLARGDVLLMAGNAQFGSSADGVYRSTDAGATWAHLSNSLLPPGTAFHMVGDRQNTDRIFVQAGNGLFRSDDTGANWIRISNGQIDSMLALAPDNVKLAAGPDNTVYVAICRNQRLSGLFRSPNLGASWNALDLPTTIEGFGQIVGIHPGGQAGIHLSLSADIDNRNLVYVGGDRQPIGAFNSFPNSLGAQDFSGRLFRVDASQPSGSQATAITHMHTASNSAPHADSRAMTFTADGTLIECDDGGVYRRTVPQTDAGDWLSLNGDIQISEFHSAAWDANTKTVIGGAQDTGTQQQDTPSGARWPSVSTGDGGVVAVDAASTAGLSVRYSSFQNLARARRQVFDQNGVFQSEIRLGLNVIGSVTGLAPQFYTPLVLNATTPTRLIIGAADRVYESFDQGDTLTGLAPVGLRANGPAAIAYGATPDADRLYVGAGAQVFVRQAAPPAGLTATAALPGARAVTGVALDPDAADTVFATYGDRVAASTDAGATWTDITNDIAAAGARMLRSVVYCRDIGNGTLVVGSNTGCYAAEAPGFASWIKLGDQLPSAPVMQLSYSEGDRLVLACTLGRGAWTLTFPEPHMAAAQPAGAGQPASPA